MKKETVNFDNLTAEQVGELFPIRIVPYNSDWKIIFEQEKELIKRALGEDVALNIEHFGSTSIEGLDSKPTIDIAVEVSNLNDEMKQHITKELGAIGYGNMHNVEKENKMTFGKGYDENYIFSQTYHIHIREKGNTPQEEIYFRDYLRQNSNVRDKYAELKYSLAEKHRFNREDYTHAKTEFITRITKRKRENIATDEKNASR